METASDLSSVFVFVMVIFHGYYTALATGCGCRSGWSEFFLSVRCGFRTCHVLFWCLKEGFSLGKTCLFLFGLLETSMSGALSIWGNVMKMCRSHFIPKSTERRLYLASFRQAFAIFPPPNFYHNLFIHCNYSQWRFSKYLKNTLIQSFFFKLTKK